MYVVCTELLYQLMEGSFGFRHCFLGLPAGLLVNGGVYVSSVE